MIRALVVTSMYPTEDRPAYGPFVRDQVEALRREPGVEVELFRFNPGILNYPKAALQLRRKYKGQKFDIVHAHFGLTAWPALLARLGPVVLTLHGTDLAHPRSRAITRAALPFVALTAAVSEELRSLVPGRNNGKNVAILPCGVDLDRFQPISRTQARKHLGLDPHEPFLLFPQDPARQVKRFDRAQAAAGSTTLLTLGDIPSEEVPFYINASNAVLVPSESEGFGLAVLEALACNVPVLATPVGIHPTALNAVSGTLCSEWDEARWKQAVQPHIASPDPRIDGRSHAALFSSDRMANQVVDAWQQVLVRSEND